MATLRNLFLSVPALLLAATIARAGAVFEHPLHLVRSVHDGIAGTQTTVDEYLEGNRIVSVRSDRVAILDLTAQTLTEIDRTARTYSVASFAELAASSGNLSGSKQTWNADRAVETAAASPGSSPLLVLVASDDPRLRYEVATDSSVTLTEAAAEVLTGAAHPQRRTALREAILRGTVVRSAGAKASTSAQQLRRHALVMRERLELDGQTIFETAITRRDERRVDPALLRIDPDMRRIEAPAVRAARELRELDRLPATERD